MQKNAIRASLAGAALLALANYAAANITYTLTPETSGGSTLTGSITTDGASQIFLSDIVSWQFTGSGTEAGSISGTGATNGAQCGPSGTTTACFAATPTTLTFSFGSTLVGQPYTTFGLGAFEVFYEDTANCGVTGGCLIWGNPSTPATLDAPNSLVGTAPVPEPSSLALLGFGLAGGLVAARRRSRG